MENSPLYRLSPELLNTIAAMVLHHAKGVVFSGKEKIPNAAALAQTCKKMREDYTTLFYHDNTFTYVAERPIFMHKIERFSTSVSQHNIRAMGVHQMVLRVSLDEDASYIHRGIRNFCNGMAKGTAARSELVIEDLNLEVILKDGTTSGPRGFIIDADHPLRSIYKAEKDTHERFDTMMTMGISLPRDVLQPELRPAAEIFAVILKRFGHRTR